MSPDDQTTLWPRLNAFGSNGVPITPTVGVRDSWVEAMARYVDECAEAELLGEEAEEPAEDKGLVEIELDAFGAKYSERWGADGSSADFFQPRQKILALLSESFPFGGAV